MNIGILGGGQLGQMLMLAAHPLGVGVGAYENSDIAPAGLVGDLSVGAIDDTDTLHKWAQRYDVITYESENFPTPLIGDLSEVRPVLPSTAALASGQDRWAEKRLFASLKIPAVPFRLVTNDQELETAVTELRLPLLFKTRTGGYDGRGQVVYNSAEDTEVVRQLLATGDLVAEQMVTLDKEISVIGVRSHLGEIRIYPAMHNEHRNGILHKSSVPADITSDTEIEAQEHLTNLLRTMDYVGVLTLEMFIVNGQLLANEMAPRVHNSGHWTIEGSACSQFENHIRAVAGLPLGSTEMTASATMINLVGAIPPAHKVLGVDGAHLHLYGKEPRPGRKVGHITVTAPGPQLLKQRVAAVEASVHNDLGN